MANEELVTLEDVNTDYRGQIIYAMGQFRSFNRHEEKKNLIAFHFVCCFL